MNDEKKVFYVTIDIVSGDHIRVIYQMNRCAATIAFGFDVFCFSILSSKKFFYGEVENTKLTFRTLSLLKIMHTFQF
jgi:hypothetical protein